MSLFTRTLRLKVRAEAYAWLNAAAVEVNEVFNYCNETSDKAATRTDRKRKWLSGFDLCYLTAGATKYFGPDRLRYHSVGLYPLRPEAPGRRASEAALEGESRRQALAGVGAVQGGQSQA